MREFLTTVIINASIIVVICAIIWGMYTFYKWFNYNVMYEDMVKETVCEMVKPEHLIVECKEN